MYPNYNIPHQRQTMQTRRNYQNYPPRNDDRFLFGGGFLGPFLLGGIAGSLVTRPNYNYPPPPPIIYYPPVPTPYYSTSNNYYY